MVNTIYFEKCLMIFRDTQIFSLQISRQYNIDYHIVLIDILDIVVGSNKDIIKTILLHPPKNIKIADSKKILKLMGEAVSGSKSELYQRICKKIDDWKSDFPREYLLKYV